MGFGVLLHPATQLSGSTDGTAVNNGAATSNGYSANLNIIETSGGAGWTLAIEGSATGSFGGEETTLATFTAAGAAIIGENASGTGAVLQYLRFTATAGAGTVTPVVSIERL